MFSFDNKGDVIGEINNSVSSDGKVITTTTQYQNGRAVYQHITVRDRTTGHVESQDVFGGKRLP